MFTAHESTHRFGGGLLGEGFINFGVVEWNLTRHWYHVLVKQGQKESAWTKVMMLGSVAELEQLMSPDSGFELLDVQLMAPPWMNGTEAWSLERIVSLTVGHDEKGMQVILHGTEGRAVYSDSPGRVIDTNSVRGFRKLDLATASNSTV